MKKYSVKYTSFLTRFVEIIGTFSYKTMQKKSQYIKDLTLIGDFGKI